MHNCLVNVCACFKQKKKQLSNLTLYVKLVIQHKNTLNTFKPKANPRGPEQLKEDTGSARRFSLLLIQLITSLKYGINGRRQFKEESNRLNLLHYEIAEK